MPVLKIARLITEHVPLTEDTQKGRSIGYMIDLELHKRAAEWRDSRQAATVQEISVFFDPNEFEQFARKPPEERGKVK